MFQPKLITTLKSYDRDQFFADAVAGVIVGVVGLPRSDGSVRGDRLWHRPAIRSGRPDGRDADGRRDPRDHGIAKFGAMISASELHSPKSDVIVLLATFGLTVFVDLTVAISVGMVLSAFLFMHRMAGVTEVSVLDRELDEDDMIDGGDIYARDPNGLRRWDIPPGVEVYEINGPFFFGAAETFKDTIAQGRNDRASVGRSHAAARRADGLADSG